jgi:PAS domain S-box-containing protein
MLWPLSGLALGLLLCGQVKYWPAIFFGTLGYNLFIERDLLSSFIVSLGNTLESLVCLGLLLRNSRFHSDLSRHYDYVLLMFAAIPSAAVAAAAGVSALLISGNVPPALAVPAFIHWWLGNMLGIILVTPLFVIWRRLPTGWFGRDRVAETVALIGLCFVSGQIVYLDWFHDELPFFAKEFWLIPLGIWAALRYGRHGITALMALTAVQMLAGALRGVGLFGEDLQASGLTQLWTYLVVMSCAGMALALLEEGRSRSVAALLDTELRWRHALEGSGAGVWDIDIANRRSYFSPTWLELFGGGPNQAIFSLQAWAKRVHPEDLPRLERLREQYLGAGQSSFVVDYRYVLDNGSYRWAEMRGTAISSDAQGRPTRFVGTTVDITERKFVETELIIGALAFDSQLPMLILDASQNILRANLALARLLGFDIAVVMGKDLDILMDRTLLEGKQGAAFWHALRDQRVVSAEFKIASRTGQLIDVLAGVSVTRGEQPHIVYYVVSLTDITERKRLLIQGEADRQKQSDALVREVHHRIKNNLQGVIGILREFGRMHPQTQPAILQVLGQLQSVAVIHGLQGQDNVDKVRLCELTQAVALGVGGLRNAIVEVVIPLDWIPFRISAKSAVPIALVLNELILNAVKHRDPALDHARISLEKGVDPGTVRLSIVNGGRWLVRNESLPMNASVGLQLVETLLPREGASLSRFLANNCVNTVLLLGPPLLTPEADGLPYTNKGSTVYE